MKEEGVSCFVGVIFRGTFCLGYFFTFSIGNYIKYQCGKKKEVLGGFHPDVRKQGFLRFLFNLSFPGCLCQDACLALQAG